VRQSKFTETQIVSILKEADAGHPVRRACQTVRLDQTTYYRPLAQRAQRDTAVIDALTTQGATRISQAPASARKIFQ
jgi:hypothetical protein